MLALPALSQCRNPVLLPQAGRRSGRCVRSERFGVNMHDFARRVAQRKDYLGEGRRKVFSADAMGPSGGGCQDARSERRGDKAAY